MPCLLGLTVLRSQNDLFSAPAESLPLILAPAPAIDYRYHLKLYGPITVEP